MGSESDAESRSVRWLIIRLPAAFLVALKETSINFPKNLVCPSVMDLVVPLDNGKPIGATLKLSNRKEIHLDGLKVKSKSAAFRSIVCKTDL